MASGNSDLALPWRQDGAQWRMAVMPSLRLLAPYWYLILATILFVSPGLLALAREIWSLEQGGHGPIILVSGLWLLLREARGIVPGRASRALALSLLAGTLVINILARVMGILSLDWLTTYGAMVVVLYAYIGGTAIRRLWFPLCFLLFLVPPPPLIVGPVTQISKQIIATTSIDMLSWFGYEVAYSGTTLYIDQYELLVADACAGMNSLFSLLAIGSLYIYLRHIYLRERAQWRYAALLGLLVVPVAVIANLVRVLLLLLITHYAGDAAAQGFLHQAAGLMMFIVALSILAMADRALAPLRHRLGYA